MCYRNGYGCSCDSNNRRGKHRSMTMEEIQETLEAVENLWRKKRRIPSEMLKIAEMIRFFPVFVNKLVKNHCKSYKMW